MEEKAEDHEGVSPVTMLKNGSRNVIPIDPSLI